MSIYIYICTYIYVCASGEKGVARGLSVCLLRGVSNTAAEFLQPVVEALADAILQPLGEQKAAAGAPEDTAQAAAAADAAAADDEGGDGTGSKRQDEETNTEVRLLCFIVACTAEISSLWKEEFIYLNTFIILLQNTDSAIRERCCMRCMLMLLHVFYSVCSGLNSLLCCFFCLFSSALLLSSSSGTDKAAVSRAGADKGAAAEVSATAAAAAVAAAAQQRGARLSRRISTECGDRSRQAQPSAARKAANSSPDFCC